MIENTENTLTAYLGPDFQLRLMWQLLVEPEFAEKTLPNLAIEYFDDPHLKRLFIIILEYFKEYDKVPNLQNKSIHQAINEYKTPNNTIEEESLFSVIKRVELWNERVINKQMFYDGDAVQKSTKWFIKQQEYRKLAEGILDKVKNGEIKNKHTISAIEDKFQKITHIGEEEDDCENIDEGIERALRKEFRETIPTGIGAIDSLTGGGLGKGEIGVILAPSGVGKTTALTIIADTAYLQEKNVAHIVFEDTKDQIKRKHYVIWADSALSKLEDDDENKRVFDTAVATTKSMEGKGRLVVKRFSQEDTTIKDIKNWMLAHQKKWGFKFDILVLDYLDCLESHKRTPDRNEAELAIIKGFEALAADMNIPAWTAIQSNRSGIGAEFVEASQTGGSIKRMQKAHFFMSIAKTPAQQEANFANIRIIKARFAKDGQMFEDCVFNNDTMKIIIDDPRYRYTKTYKNLKHHDKEDLDKLEKKAENISKMHMALSQQSDTGTTLHDLKNNKTEAEKFNDLLRINKMPEEIPKEDTGKIDIIEEIEILEDYNEKKKDKLLEIDVNEEIEILDTNDGVNEGVNHINNSDLLEFTGERAEVEKEVKIEDIPPIVEKLSVDLTKFVLPGVFVQERDDGAVHEPKFTGMSTNHIMNEILATDPDAKEGQNKSVYEFLVKKREYQHVVKKE